MIKVNIYIKKAGKNRPEAAPVLYEYPDTIKTVRELVEETVRISLQNFEKKRSEAAILRMLSREEQQEKAKSGKIAFGALSDNARPDFNRAVEIAWQCLEDGTAVLFVDGERKEKLDMPVFLQEGSELTFVKMAMLVGRMW